MYDIVKISLNGLSESGKDTVADFITEYYHEQGYKVVRFGNGKAIKQMVSIIEKVSASEQNDPEVKKRKSRVFPGKTIRDVQIDLAEGVRARVPEFWAAIAAAELAEYERNVSADTVFIKTDDRMPAEMAQSLKSGFTCVSVIRPDRVIKNTSSSEFWIPTLGVLSHEVIANRSTLAALKNNTYRVLDGIDRQDTSSESNIRRIERLNRVFSLISHSQTEDNLPMSIECARGCISHGTAYALELYELQIRSTLSSSPSPTSV